MNSLVSVVIPTLNEAESIGPTLEAVARMRGAFEVILVDAGSPDGTARVAGRYPGVRFVTSGPGRGVQMHAGVAAARGEAVWFLHADTSPPEDGVEKVLEALADPKIVAGNFAVRFDGPRRAARFLTWFYPQLRRFGMIYGDSAIFVRKSSYLRAGGFRPFPMFEDLDLVRRLARLGRLAHVPSCVTTSSRRFHERSFTAAMARAAALQILYWLGIPPRVLYRFYPQIRGVVPGPSADAVSLTTSSTPAAPPPPGIPQPPCTLRS
ncbi:MAG TPA: TIGR04283 family arsenosugar biosynthesis glycosyltransferase [Bryobacteraceae bacterium]|nr:TIGR04283 family arsenosugar biosynthesis glycosyltransferase [Bryobacteraceae bacterium]